MLQASCRKRLLKKKEGWFEDVLCRDGNVGQDDVAM
jgi:hypothetical protein